MPTMPNADPLAIQQARAAYRAAFGGDAPWLAWAPGRVNLIGEHTDYNDGWVLPAALDRLVALAGQPRTDGVVRLFSQQYQEMAEFTLHGLTPATSRARAADLPGWARYVLGVAAELLGAGCALAGVDAAIAGDVPPGAGMSSSAALEVASSMLFTAPLGAELAPLARARLCQQAEQRAVGVRVGILDQAASCLGRAGQAILLDCRSLEYEYLPARLPGVALVICDTGVRRELAHSAYNERRQQCEQATALLAGRLASEGRTEPVTALRDVSLDELTRHADALPAPLLQRARHVVSENARVQQAALALRAGDTHALGALLFASHASLRDDYAVSCLELDTMVELARQVPGILGARLLGAGFGGCALVLCAQAGVGLLRAVLARNYPARTGRAARVFVGGIGGGPGAVRLR